MTRIGPTRGAVSRCWAVLLFVSMPTAADAGATLQKTNVERQIGTCIRKASGGRAWLEKTLWGLRDQEGGTIGSEVPNTNGTHDLGPLQINSWWVPKIARRLSRAQREVRHWLQFDVCFNVGAAKWIFLSNLSEARDFWIAVGAYHSPRPLLQRRYALMVAGKLKLRFGSLRTASSLSWYRNVD